MKPSLWSNSHICRWLWMKTNKQKTTYKKTTYKKLRIRWLQTKPIALTIQIFVSQLMSLLFNMLSRFVITFLLRRQHLLIAWLRSRSAVASHHLVQSMLLQGWVNWKSLSRVRLFATPWTVHGILQARILEWVAFPFSRGSSQPRDPTQVSHIEGGFFTIWTTREAQEYWSE